MTVACGRRQRLQQRQLMVYLIWQSTLMNGSSHVGWFEDNYDKFKGQPFHSNAGRHMDFASLSTFIRLNLEVPWVRDKEPQGLRWLLWQRALKITTLFILKYISILKDTPRITMIIAKNPYEYGSKYSLSLVKCNEASAIIVKHIISHIWIK